MRTLLTSLIFIFALQVTSYSQKVRIKGMVFLKNEPRDDISKITLTPNDSVTLIQRYTDFWKVSFGDQIGYVHNSAFVQDQVYNDFVAKNPPLKYIDHVAIAKEKEAAIAKQKAASTDKKARESKFIAKYGKTYGLLVASRKINLGMSKQMVIDSWGNPEDVNRTVGGWGVHEQWVYGSGTYLYFENGKLTSWQD